MIAVVMRRAFLFLVIGAGLVALLWLWALQPGGVSPRDGGRIFGSIEYTVRDVSGNLKESKLIHNATLDLLLNDARTRLGDATALTLGAGTAYDDIALLSTNASGAEGTLIATARFDVGNPQSGTYTALGESGNYSVAQTFVVQSGADITVEEVQLAKGTTAGTAPTTSKIGAWQNVGITLSAGDSLTITWTVDID